MEINLTGIYSQSENPKGQVYELISTWIFQSSNIARITTGRELYYLKQQLDKIDNQIKSVMNKENPAAAGAVLDEDHTLIPSDNIRIKNNFQKAMQNIASLSLIDNKLK